jgi:hypothetical protein
MVAEPHPPDRRLEPGRGWNELFYQTALQRAIKRGLAQADTGQLIAAEDLLREFEAAE